MLLYNSNRGLNMKLYYDKKSSNPTYFVQKGIRLGKKTTTRNIMVIGKHSDLLSITNDPLSYAREKVKEINKQFKEQKVELNINIDFDEKLTNFGSLVSKSTCRNIGYFYLKQIYEQLNISKFLDDTFTDKKCLYNYRQMNLALTISRILNPGSKLHMLNNLSEFFGNYSFSHQQILRFMDILEENFDEYVEHLFKQSNKVIKRNTSVCYFDCTNFYFEKETEDPDEYDEVTGEVISGLLKYGVSKEHRPNPIVQMGLFMDGDGIPLSVCVNPGNQNESLCAVPAEQSLLKMFKDKDIIYCADGGLGYSNQRKFNDMGGRRFVVTQSIKKLPEVIKQAVFNDCDYKFSGTKKPASLKEMQTFDIKEKNNLDLYNGYVYKSVPVNSDIDLGIEEIVRLKNGKTRKKKAKATIKQRLIITYSRKMAEYQKRVRNRQVERAKDIIKHMDPEKYKKGPNDVNRFIACSKGERTYHLDQAKIEEEEKYDGFYAVATNILNDDTCSVRYDEIDIISIQSRRYKIEDCFRILKTNFSSRPVYHFKKERIKAHFLICFTSLLIYRLLEVLLDRNGTHYPPNTIIETIRNMNVVNCNELYYQACYTGSNLLDSLEQLYTLGLNHRYYEPGKLQKLAKIKGE